MKTTSSTRASLALIVLLAFATSAHAVVNVLDYWRLGENDPGASNGLTATNFVDIVTGNEMTVTGSATYSSDVSARASSHLFGAFSAAFFNGAQATTVSVSDETVDFGIEAWIKPASVATGQAIVYNGDSGSTGWGIYINNSTWYGLYGGVTYIQGTVATPNVWTHVALVCQSNITTLSINGQVAGSTNSLGGIGSKISFSRLRPIPVQREPAKSISPARHSP